MPHTDYDPESDHLHSTIDEPLWYTLSELMTRDDTLSDRPREEVFALAQMLHDLRIPDVANLLRRLDALYVEDHSKPLHGEYYYRVLGRTSEERYPDVAIGQMPRYKADAREMRASVEPRKSNRRRAIEATKEKKAKERECEGS